VDLERFIQERDAGWKRLDALLRRAGRSLGSLGKDDLRDLGALYRQTASDLARVQAAEAEADLVEYLTGLVVRGHGVIYRREPARLAQVWAFLSRGFPRLIRQEWRPILLATLLAVIPGLWCYVLASFDPEFLEAVTPPTLRARLDKGELWVYRINPIKPVASSVIMTNNIAVTFTFFALGMTFGLGTGLGLINNGIHFGTIAAVVGQSRMAPEFWAFVAPHGSLELPAIFIGGGAGLILGASLLFPGDLRRRDALAERGRVAVLLVAGCVPILVVAGIIEAFVSPAPPSVMPLGRKYLAGSALFMLLLAYLLRAGTGPEKMTTRSLPFRSFLAASPPGSGSPPPGSTAPAARRGQGPPGP
jgi:uncharacterized membrane protein SpoIIM required for sporulation